MSRDNMVKIFTENWKLFEFYKFLFFVRLVCFVFVLFVLQVCLLSKIYLAFFCNKYNKIIAVWLNILETNNTSVMQLVITISYT